MSAIFAIIRFVFLSKRRGILTSLAFLICFAAAQKASAATFTVTRNDDRNQTCNSDVDCSWREAVKAANATITDDTINFAAGLTLITLAGDTNLIQINNAGTLIINGPGANILTIDGGAGTNRIFSTNNAVVTLYGVTIQGGNGSTQGNQNGAGGAIAANGGSLVLNSVVLRNNGGNSISGGALSFSSGTHSIVNSTISNNQAVQCGGIYVGQNGGQNIGVLSIVNSTLSGNSAAIGGAAGGGLCNEGTVNIRNSTIANNTATVGDGGGIVNFATLNIGNTIIAGNKSLGVTEIYNTGAVASAGNNLIGDSAGDSTNTLNAITYQASDILDKPPLLGALQNNGGATPTHALLSGSPAIDKGGNALAIDPFNNSVLTTDQPGLTRFIDGNADGAATVDIGAFEKQIFGTTAARVTVGGRVQTPNGEGISNVRVTLTNFKGETRTAISDDSGEFRFTDVEVGETYVFSAAAKRCQFSQPTQIQTILDIDTDINFIGFSEKRRSL